MSGYRREISRRYSLMRDEHEVLLILRAWTRDKSVKVATTMKVSAEWWDYLPDTSKEEMWANMLNSAEAEIRKAVLRRKA